MNRLRHLALACVAAASLAWRSHPIHAARIALAATADGAVTVVVRVYRDDLPPASKASDLAGYIDRSLIVTDARGTRVVLRLTAAVPEGDRLRIDLAGRASSDLSRGRIAVTLMQERFPDQVNVVDAQLPGKRAQLVLLRGDGPQALP